MNLRKILIAAFACALISLGALSLVGCASSSADAPSSQSGGMRTITDAYGRTVELPAEVDSAATVGSAARFVVYAGGQDKLIAVTEMEKDPGMNRPYTMAFKDLFASLPSTSNGNHLMETSVNVEELIRIDPDVIISSRSAEECDQLAQDSGIPVVGISYQNQLFSDDVIASIRCTGEALGTQEHAEGVIEHLQSWQASLKERGEAARAALKAQGQPEPTVYVGAINYKGAKSWGGTYAHYAPCEAVGALNVADGMGQAGAVDVDLEQIAQWDPDFMFLNAGNYDLLKQDYDQNPAFFQSLTAFQDGDICTQPFYNFNGTNVDTGVCDAYFIGATIYPEQFADVDLEDLYAEVYEVMLDGFDFYGLMQQNGMGFTRFPSFEESAS